MAYEKIDFGRKYLLYDIAKESLVGYGINSDYMTENQRKTNQVIELKDSFKERGSLVVKPFLKSHWEKTVESALNKKQDVLYNAACLEATLKCMERLSKGEDVRNAYMPIDIHNQEACCHFGIELSAWQNYNIATAVNFYHDRGHEFLEYRNTHFRKIEKIKRLI